MRRFLTGEEKALLLQKHGFKSAACDSPFSCHQGEWDHVIPRCQGGKEFQPLCLACHREKTLLEPQALENDVLASHLQLGAYEAYVSSPRMPPLVFKSSLPAASTPACWPTWPAAAVMPWSSAPIRCPCCAPWTTWSRSRTTSLGTSTW